MNHAKSVYLGTRKPYFCPDSVRVSLATQNVRLIFNKILSSIERLTWDSAYLYLGLKKECAFFPYLTVAEKAIMQTNRVHLNLDDICEVRFIILNTVFVDWELSQIVCNCRNLRSMLTVWEGSCSSGSWLEPDCVKRYH